MSLRVLLWNVEWATAQSRRGRIIRERIDEAEPDLVCITEGYDNFLGDGWHVVCGGIDPGYRIVPGRRKVLLASRSPWTEVDLSETTALPIGRFVTALTETPIGRVRCVGVCIPWAHAHVTHGRKDRRVWEEHLLYFDALDRVLADTTAELPIILLGDFNQRIPRMRSPERAFQRLIEVIGSRFSIETSGVSEPGGKQTIDHICLTESLQAASVEILANTATDGTRLSDHFGLIASISFVN